MAKDDVFEEGKQVEDYLGDPDLVNELNALEIEPEANPDAEQRLETVVETPVRNEKKKPEPKPPVPQAPVQKEPVVPPPVEQPTAPESILEQPQQQNQVEPDYLSFDEWLKKTSEAVGRQWYKNAQNTLIGVVTGQLQVIQPQTQLPPQQQVQQTQPQQQERIVVKDNSEAVGLLRGEVDRIEMEIIDSVSDTDLRLLQAEKRLLKKQIMKLEGTYVEPVEQPLPVSAKVVKPQKTQSNVTPKVALALVGLFLVGGIGIILLINSLIH